MALEIERKFLVTGDYKSLATSHSRIVQGYICSERGRTVRVRLRDERGYLTIKGPSNNGGLSRYEFEHEISKDEALSLFRLCEPGIVDKIRWLVPAATRLKWTSSSAKTKASLWPKWNWAAKTKLLNAPIFWERK